jgi:hypothetical protein
MVEVLVTTPVTTKLESVGNAAVLEPEYTVPPIVTAIPGWIPVVEATVKVVALDGLLVSVVPTVTAVS